MVYEKSIKERRCPLKPSSLPQFFMSPFLFFVSLLYNQAKSSHPTYFYSIGHLT